MTCLARYTQLINGTSKGNAMWLVDFPHCSSMNEGIYIILIKVYAFTFINILKIYF